MNKVFHVMYDDDDKLLEAARELVGKGIHVNDVYSPFPVHGIDPIIEDFLLLKAKVITKVLAWEGGFTQTI